jgi:hypothetical protein
MPNTRSNDLVYQQKYGKGPLIERAERLKRLHDLQQNIQSRRETSARRDYPHYEAAGGDKQQAAYQRVRAQESSRQETRQHQRNPKEYLNNELYEDVLYRMPQVEDDPVPLYRQDKAIGNLNNLPSINGSNRLGAVGNQIVTNSNYTPIQKSAKAAPQVYGSNGKYGYQNSSIDALNAAYLYKSRSKDTVELQSYLKSNRYGGGTASVVAEGRIESGKG